MFGGKMHAMLGTVASAKMLESSAGASRSGLVQTPLT